MNLRVLLFILLFWAGTSFLAMLLAILLFLMLMQRIDDLNGWD
uniref:E5 protein n=1 Tax=Bos taurus papillomavirus 10 TaxID=453461 RepID=A0A3G3BTC7_9PAPI|nr:E5 protein [Bos taurus papillomavirus 10]